MRNTPKVFLDTEFTTLNQNTDLISLALVTLDGPSLYITIKDVKTKNSYLSLSVKQQNWLEGHVFKSLHINSENYINDSLKVIACNYSELKQNVEEWLYHNFNSSQRIEIWSDVLAYDWVLFCEVWGGSMALPELINYIPIDFSTWLHCKGIDRDINREDLINELPLGKKHNALYDALLISQIYKKLDHGN